MSRKHRHAPPGRPVQRAGPAPAQAALLNRAVAAVQAGDLAEAESLYQRLTALCPREPAIHAKLGDVRQRRGNLPGAAECFRRAIALRPDYAEGHLRLGNVLLLSGDTLGAIESYRNVLSLSPDLPEAHTNLGNALLRLGRMEEAIAALRRATELRPDFAAAHFNLGNAYLHVERLEDSLASLQRALELKPDMAVGYSDIGNVLYMMGRRDKAIVAYGNAIALDPTLAEAYSNLANPLTDDDRLDEAMTAAIRSIQLRPDRPEAHSNFGNVLVAAGRLQEAIGPYRHALTLKPDYAAALTNLGHVMGLMGRADESIAAYREALRLAPADADAHLFLAMMLLRKGEMQEGWREYEWRWKTRLFQRESVPGKAPEWDGEPLAGKDILLYAEQGLGDTLQFARYAPLLAAMGARVTLAVQPPLARLMATVPGVDRVITESDRVPAAHYRTALMSLPRLVGPELAQIPASVPYIFADPEAAARWKQRLSALPGRKVGVVWAGAPRPHDRAANRTDRRRSLSLSQIAPILDVPGLSFLSLQKGPPAEKLKQAGPLPLHDYMDEIGDFADTAALVAALDLVIAADTSVAHLAGAMGKPVWILSRFDGCWRWREEGETTPWYPTARLFRQKAPDTWDEVVGRVVEALHGLPPEALA